MNKTKNAHDEASYYQIIKKLPKQSKSLLDLIYDHSGIDANTIQRKMRFKSRHTFLKYINALITNKLVKVQKNIVDKRQKQFEVTSKGRLVRQLIIRQSKDDCLTCYLKNCEKLFLSTNPKYINSLEWMKFVETTGYSVNFIESIENQVFSYISKNLNQLNNNS
ncbi:MAG: hypothetical protein ACFFAU_05540 [Candidatus Hodarchaeota archaeon]